MKTITKGQAQNQKLVFSGFGSKYKTTVEKVVLDLKKKFPNSNVKIVEEKDGIESLVPKVKYYVWGNISSENYKLVIRESSR